MKKVLSFVCAMAVAASCTATAFAADENATPGQIVNDKAQEVVKEIKDVSLDAKHYNVVVNEVLKPALTNDDVHISKAAADLGARAIAVAADYDAGLTQQQSEAIELQESVPAPVQTQATPAESEATVTEQPAEAAPAESTAEVETPAESTPAESEAGVEATPAESAPAESKTVAEEPAEGETAESTESEAAEEPSKEVSVQADEAEAAPVAVESEAAEEEAPAESAPESEAEGPVQSEDAVPAKSETVAPVESETAAPAESAVAEEPAAEVSVQADAQPVAAAAKEFGAVKLLTAANQTIDFSQVTGSITNDSKNVYTLTVNMPVDRSATPAGYEVTVYGLDCSDYQMVYGTDVKNGVRLDNITNVVRNEQNPTKWDVTFWVPHFSTYTICPAKEENNNNNNTTTTSSSSSSHSHSSYEAPDDSIYYTCPKCGYHNWTATTGGYRCDHCGYLEEVKELAGWPNVNGVADKSAAAASVYAGAIKATGASMSVVALFALAMAGAVVGGAAYLVRKNGLGE